MVDSQDGFGDSQEVSGIPVHVADHLTADEICLIACGVHQIEGVITVDETQGSQDDVGDLPSIERQCH